MPEITGAAQRTQARRRLVALALLIVALVFAIMPAQFGLLAQSTRAGLPTNTPRGGSGSTGGGSEVVTATPAPVTQPFQAKLCADCLRVRIRATPGTAGEVVGFVPPDAQFSVVARSNDALWLQIVLLDGSSGWVSVDFVRGFDGKPFSNAVIDGLPIAGEAIEASVTPTSSLGIPAFLSGVTSNARTIFLKGRELGNAANVFVRIGDSITVSPNFLFDIGVGKVDLGGYGVLGSVIDFYKNGQVRGGNSFTIQPIAAGGGWASEALFIPGYSFPEVCGQRTPLVCELEVTKPAVALIMIGTNDSGSGSPDTFGNNLRTIVEITIKNGTIPVLSTIPPKNIDEDQTRRVDAFNRVIRQVAQFYEIPLWDYYYSMAQLPNNGMSADGLHPSVPPNGRVYSFTPENLQYGYTLRNLQALQVLDTLWRLVQQ
ncbi:MAG: GDSL-type esterase/lipase family protein [Anaerolineae bacterium]|nr:SH3 domain-containing protein [Anaerolineae bacterium]